VKFFLEDILEASMEKHYFEGKRAKRSGRSGDREPTKLLIFL